MGRRRVEPSLTPLAVKRDEAAAVLGMSPEHFDRHVRDEVPVVYSGRLRLYPVRGLEQWLVDNAVRPARTFAAVG